MGDCGAPRENKTNACRDRIANIVAVSGGRMMAAGLLVHVYEWHVGIGGHFSRNQRDISVLRHHS